MSSQVRKLEQKIDLKKRNAWLSNAFRKAMAAAVEQSDNATELTRALVIALQKNGPVTITRDDIAALDPNTRLRAATDRETGTVIYSAYVEAPQQDAEQDAAYGEHPEFQERMAEAHADIAAGRTTPVAPEAPASE